MFLQRSRYVKVRKCEALTKDGRTVKIVTIRPLPQTSGKATTIVDDDRLDIYSQRLYNDPTRFWHIADANTELQANDLVATPARTINVPES